MSAPDPTAYDDALAWLDAQSSAGKGFPALAVEALCRGLSCTCAIVVGDRARPALQASHGQSGIEVPASLIKTGGLLSDPHAQGRYWFGTVPSPHASADLASVHGYRLHDHAGHTMGYVAALGPGAMAHDAGATMFFRLVAERISHALAPTGQSKETTTDYSSSLSRELFDSCPIGISITTINDGTILFANKWWAESYNVPAEDMVGTNISSYHPDPVVRAELLARMKSEGFISSVEVQVARDVGRGLTWILLSLYPIQFEGQSAVIGWAHDIDERKRAETELRLSEQRFQSFADASADWFWETDRDHIITYLSDGFERSTDLPQERLLGADRRRALETTATTPIDFEVLQKIDAHEPMRDHTQLYMINGRDDIWIRTSSLPIFDPAGNFAGYRGTTANITAEIDTRQRLQSSADRYLNAIDSMFEGVALWDWNDRLVVCNRRFQEFNGNNIHLFQIGMTFEEFIRASAAAGGFDVQGEMLERQITERLEAHRNPPSDIEVRRLNRTLNIREQRTPDGGTISIAIDMTQQRLFEEQLRQSQKMELVGQLTGGIAHDFNNLLAVISGNLELLENRAKGQEDLTRFIERGLAAADRGSQLTNRLLSFSRQQPLVTQITSLDRLVAGMLDLVQRTLGETIQIKTAAGAGPWPCLVDVSQLENATLNLAINARDAMPGGGDLTIATKNQDLTTHAAAQELNVEPGQYVTLSVTDTGTGMETGVAERAFDPFFTTKDVGKGSGLGLSMVYSFVQQSGGQVRINSVLGEGTTVTIYLPRNQEPNSGRNINGITPVNNVVDQMARVDGRNALVLVVDQDDETRHIAAAMLRELGYRVLQANQGRTAMDLIAHNSELDLLITDAALPDGMSAKTLVAGARNIKTGLAVLFLTAQAGETSDLDGDLEPNIHWLEKPFGKLDLALSVRRALDA